MKILWIEDFGGKLARSKIVVEIFKEFFEDVNLEKEYDQSNPDVAAQLAYLFRKYTLHEVYVCNSYLEWKRLDQQHQGDFDLALIDINLESYATSDEERPDGIDSDDFDKRAGFYIYHQLIKRGYPDNNIAFFTGERHSLKEFGKYCSNVLLDRPAHCFEKSPVHFSELRRWLYEKSLQESLILRRGIVEGCRFMKAKIEAIDSADLVPRLIFYKTIPGTPGDDTEALRRDSLEYLTRLERFFLSHQGYDDAELRNWFLKELAAKWEPSRGYFIRAKKAPRFGSWLEEQFHRTAQFQMKMLRNWSSHRLLSSHLAAKEFAYFFLLAMRSFVESDLNEIFRYERILSTLFNPLSDLELNRLMNSSLGFDLERSYEQLRVLHKEVLSLLKEFPDEKRAAISLNRRMDNYFLGIFRELGEVLNQLEQLALVNPSVLEFHRHKIKNISVSLFYQSFWHGLFPLEIKTTFYADLQTIKFNLEPLTLPFLVLLGQAIFAESFRAEEVSVNVA